MNEKLRIQQLHKSFGTNVIFSGITLSVMPGEIVSVIGKSGTGKSVLLKHLIGLLTPDSGQIFVDNLELTGADRNTREEIVSRFGVLFQGAALFDSMNIYDNIAFGMRRQDIDEDEIARRVPEMLSHVGLRDMEKKLPSELSGGMQKRAGLARAIARRPEIMLYDEPTTGVDPITGGAVDRLILHMRDEFHITSIVVTHDMQSAYRVADRIVMLYEGAIIFNGTPDEIRQTQDPVVQQFIEGRAHGPVSVT